MPAVILTAMTERILSPDGTQFWDSSTSTWRPVETPATPAPVAPEADPASQYPTAAAHSAPATQLATQRVLPPPAAPGVQPDESGPGNSWAVNKWAWRVALSPFIWGGLVWWLINADAPEWSYAAVGFAILVGATFATDQDVRTLGKHGVSAQQAFTAAVLLFYVIGAPAYLIHRTLKARTSAFIPVTWFIGVLFAATPFVLGGFSDGVDLLESDDVYVPGIEESIAEGLQEGGVRGAVVDCPDGESYDDGDMVICDVTSRSDGEFEVVVEMRNDGYFQWQAQ